MAVAIITGSSGLIGSETVKFFHEKGLHCIGIDNNMREYFFGKDGSVAWNTQTLQKQLSNFEHHTIDIRNEVELNKLFSKFATDIVTVVHCAAQPSHDWAAKEPLTDFTINALGTVNLLECTRNYCPNASFIFTSTNKVYGDTPNYLPLEENATRWEIKNEHKFYTRGIDESMSIDQSKHSVFGASKVAADIMVQEYGKYFGLNTGVFRGGCLTGPAHSGAELHGFLAYLVKCVMEERHYTIYGYKGKQVRDNIHSSDLVNAFWHFHNRPTSGKVYNIGGSRHSHCSVLEAISMIQELAGKKLNYTISENARSGDHIWWVSDVSQFKDDYPEWRYRYDLQRTIQDIIDANRSKSNLQRAA